MTTDKRMHHIEIYHNLDSRFLTYDPRHTLVQVFSTWQLLAADISPERIADWLFPIFNTDLDTLEMSRQAPGGETDFLLACVYRLLRRRSLSTADVIAITVSTHTTWLAYLPVGFHRIDRPVRVTGEPFTAAAVYAALSGGRDA